MSYYGKTWKIDGVVAGLILRSCPGNGQYTVVFEREYASLEQIEAINWAQPTVEYLGTDRNEPGLPEGYGFEVANIAYQSGTRSYQVELKVGAQYLGDVTGYQDQIAELESAAAEKDSTIALQRAVIDEQEGTIQEQTGTIEAQTIQIEEQNDIIEAQTAAIETLQQAGSAADLENELDAAYEEGVNSVE